MILLNLWAESPNYLSMGTHVKVIIPWDDWYCDPFGDRSSPIVMRTVLKSFVMRTAVDSFVMRTVLESFVMRTTFESFVMRTAFESFVMRTVFESFVMRTIGCAAALPMGVAPEATFDF